MHRFRTGCTLPVGLVTSVFAGCNPVGETLFVALPSLDGAQSAVIGRTEARSLSVEAQSIEDGLRFEAETVPELSLALYLLALSDLGLSAGPIAPVASCERSCSLATPHASYRLDPNSPEWKRDELSLAMLDVLLPDRSRRCTDCVPFLRELLLLPTAPHIAVRFALREPEGSVLLGVPGRDIYRVRVDRSVEIACTNAGASSEAAVLAAPGVLWIAAGRSLSRVLLDPARPGEPCQVASSTTTSLLEAGTLIRAIDGVETSEGPEIFVIADDRSFLRFDRTGFHRLGRINSISENIRAFVVRLGPGRALAGLGGPTVIRAENLVTSEDSIPKDPRASAVVAAVYAPALGLVFGLDTVGLVVEDDLGTTAIEILNWTSPGVMIPLPAGVLYTQLNGAFGRQLGATTCPVESGFSSERVFVAALLGEDQVVFGDTITNKPTQSAAGLLVPDPGCP